LGTEPVSAQLKLADVGAISDTAEVTVLTSAEATDNNSLDQPTRVLPVESSVSVTGNDFQHEFPANSLTVLRLKGR
jgi:alpha-L-arabinofuranosidase